MYSYIFTVNKTLRLRNRNIKNWILEALIMKQLRLTLVMVCGLVFLLGAVNISWGVNVKPTLVRPANDNCSNAKPVGNITNQAFDTTNATFDGPGHYIRSPNIWYCYTATCNGCATVSLRGSSFDTKVAVYEGCDCYPGSDDLIKSNDDFFGQQSQATFPVKAGSQYLIEVGGFNPTIKGQGVISISCDPQSSQPVNDDCAGAKQIGNVTEQPFDTTCATFDGPGHFFTSPNLWYRFTAQRTGDVTVSLLGSEYDTALVVYKGGNCYPKAEDIVERNDDFGGFLQSQITFQATAGNSYLFEVMGYNADEVGQGVLTVSAAGQPPSTNNDECSNAKQIVEVTNEQFNTATATFDGPHHCIYSKNIWFCYTASCTGEATVSLAGSSFDTMLAVYNGCECYPEESDMIECNDDTASSRQSEITFDAVAGSQYLIEVGGYGNEAGQGLLTVSCQGTQPPPSSKDDCQNAKVVSDVKDLAFSTVNATFDGPGLCMTSPNVWYCYTATCTGNATVSLVGSSFDTMLAVYDGCQCYPTADDLIECNDDSGNTYQSAITFAATMGSQYLIEIGGYGSEKGAGLLTISCQGTVTQNKTDLGDAPDSTNNAHRSMMAYPTQGMLQVIVPASYPTVYNDGSGTGPFGPVHLNAQAVAFLGKKITRETEADIGTDEDGVNNIRPSNDTPDRDQGDDGVVFPINMPNCRYTTIDYVVNVIDPNADLWVNIWLDWNRDGDWDDTLECPAGPVPEWAVQNQLLINMTAGSNQITTPGFLCWHPENGREDIWMRITLAEQPWRRGSNPGAKGNAGSGPQAKYAIGETEDYHFTPDVSFAICEDYNGDGVVDMDDLAAFVSEWLENCP
jgi:hypothetical protein